MPAQHTSLMVVRVIEKSLLSSRIEMPTSPTPVMLVSDIAIPSL